MIQVRKLVLAIAAASALHSGSVLALGLGEVTLRSALNQPLNADIELLQAKDLSADELIARLASAEAFSSAGIDRQHFLTGLKFTPVINANGKSVIRVTSSQPVREPYLNFLVEVNWPSGRLLREYTLLLDPPLYTPQPVVASALQRPIASTTQAPVSRASTPAPQPRAAAPVAPRAAANTGPKQYRTTSSDTLWAVAQRVGSGTTDQAMLAIQDLNPDAFINGNINLMKRGQTLRLPDAQQVAKRSPQEAARLVSEQNRAWAASRNKSAPVQRQVDATARTAAAAAPAQVATDSLKLVGDGQGQAASGSDQGNAQALSENLAVTKESLDVTKRENAELKDRMADLESQLEKIQRLVELKDNQLAKLQSDMAQLQDAAPAAEEPVAALSAPQAQVPVAEPVVAELAQPVQPSVDTPEPEAAAPIEPAEVVAPEAIEQPLASQEPEPVEPVAPAVTTPPQAAVQAPEPAPAEANASSQSALAALLQNSTLTSLLGGGALLLLLLLLLFLSRRNAQREAQVQAQLNQGREAESIPLAPSQVAAEDAAQSSEDVLAEADVYIAYGRFNQAATLLENAINDQPQRTDLRLRLLEVYAELGDRDSFVRQETELREMAGDVPEVAAIKAKYPSVFAVAAAAATASVMAQAAEPVAEQSPAFDSTLADALAAQPAASASDAPNAFNDINLDDLTLDDLELPEASAAPVVDEAFDVDFEDFEAQLQRELETEEPLNIAAAQTEVLAPEVDAQSPADELIESFAEQPSRQEAEDVFSVLQAELDAVPSPAEQPLALDDELESFDLPSADDLQRELDAMVELTEDDAGVAETPVLAQNLPPVDELSFDLAEVDPVQAQEQANIDDLLKDFEFEESAPESLEAAAPQALAEQDLTLDADFDLSLAVEEPVESLPDTDSFLAELEQVNAELNNLGAAVDVPLAAPVAPAVSFDEDDEFDFLSGTDETATKLDLARAYVDMGDNEGARDILEEVLSEGNDVQQSEARELLSRLA